ncbi:hypothetical protein [Sphingomonas sp. M1-B02]|uniref:hypothetical protein n=1 Tax=Sphingomonas sp. M1-B02 TaxID=3114300 RepID=UPI00223F70CE|nr:hypothetical protein [Sphingomonas sp. S6-11]UZK67819.1 hypothetical protein OKW87_08360 [Sphingomonas sp. S6-11]
MTTYPLSEPATIRATGAPDALGRGTLEECTEVVAGLSPEMQKSASIEMDGLDLKFGPREIGELLRFLREENAGLSNNEITEIKTADS